MKTYVANVEVRYKFAVLTEPDTENTEKELLENIEPQQTEEIKQNESSQDEMANKNNQAIKPPPISIREKKHWPNICETSKNFGIRSENNFNTRDGIKMIFSSMEMYNKCTSSTKHKAERLEQPSKVLRKIYTR
ncbi:hypothetical protein JTB14_036037 [Gonioctena quinquepunctata]|nr:hypothetical protein JTB14_036037 [Gonioctena quinquepunctata]